MFFGMRKRGDQEDITPYVIGYDAETTGVETLNTLKFWEQQHKLDPNLPIEDLNEIDGVLAEGNCEKGIEVEAALLEDNSPYPEVRLMVRGCRRMFTHGFQGPRRCKELRCRHTIKYHSRVDDRLGAVHDRLG